jgi:hypothetical protein
MWPCFICVFYSLYFPSLYYEIIMKFFYNLSYYFWSLYVWRRLLNCALVLRSVPLSQSSVWIRSVNNMFWILPLQHAWLLNIQHFAPLCVFTLKSLYPMLKKHKRHISSSPSKYDIFSWMWQLTKERLLLLFIVGVCILLRVPSNHKVKPSFATIDKCVY